MPEKSGDRKGSEGDLQMEQFEQHVRRVDRREATVRALVGWDCVEARKRAESAGKGPLAGWAVGVKDIIDVAGMPTLCGVDFLPAIPAAADAAVVDRLRSLGAYVFSKTVTTAFAHFDPGPTTNPWNAAYTPGGSSMGSAAATSAGMIRVGVGTQTVGSINRPASFCGVAGFKPTYELMSQAGLFPYSPSVDTIGFFTANARAMLVLCRAFFGKDGNGVPSSLRIKDGSIVPSSLRIGVVEDMLCKPANQEMLGAVRRVCKRVKEIGFDVQPARLPKGLAGAYENHKLLITAELALSHGELFEKYGGHYPPKIRQSVLTGRKISSRQIRECLKRRARFQDQLDEVFDEFDVLLTPSAHGTAPKGLSSTGDPRMSLIFTHTGVPSLTLPAKIGRNRLPLGVQLSSRRMHDRFLVAAGARIERAIGLINPGLARLVRDLEEDGFRLKER